MARRIQNIPRFVFSLALMGLLVYLTGYGIYTLFFKEDLLYQPTYGVVPLEVTTDALLVREELLVYSDYAGDIVYEAIDGERIKRSAPVARVQVDPEGGSDPVTPRSPSLERYLVETEKDLEKQLDEAMTALAEAVRTKAYRAVPERQQEVESLFDRQRRLASAESGDSEAVKALTGLIENNIVALRSPRAGILTYSYDGYENVLTGENLAKIDAVALLAEPIVPEALKKNKVNREEPVFKIIDSTTYFFLFAVPEEESYRYERGKAVRIDVEGQQVNGMIDDFFVQKDHLIVLVRSDEQFNHFHKRRRVAIRLKIDDYQGLKLHADSLVQRQGVIGVYRLDQNQRADFTPVKVLGSTDEMVVVKDGTFIQVENETAETVKTIDLFDQVLRQGEGFEQGDKVQ